MTEVLVVSDTEVLVVDAPTSQVEVLTQALQGDQGPPGPPGPAGAAVLTYRADGPLGGHRVVRANGEGGVVYADNSVLADANTVVGITTGAAEDGAEIHVQASGEMTESSWNWTLDLPIFLGSNGGLTQAPPTTGFLLVVATVISPTTVLVSVKSPIIL